MTPCLQFATWNVHNAPSDDPRRACDSCGRIRAAHRPRIRRVNVDRWVWCTSVRQIEPACASDEWIEYVPPTDSQIVRETAARYDERCPDCKRLHCGCGPIGHGGL